MSRSRRNLILIGFAGLVMFAASLGLWAYINAVTRAGARTIQSHELGTLLPLPGIQQFKLFGPQEGAIQIANSVWFSLEFRGIMRNRTDDPSTEFDEGKLNAVRVKGRGTLRIIADGKTIVKQAYALTSENTMHNPRQSYTVRVASSGSEFEMPKPNKEFLVEFEWEELPQPLSECVLWWCYYTTLDLGFD